MALHLIVLEGFVPVTLGAVLLGVTGAGRVSEWKTSMEIKASSRSQACEGWGSQVSAWTGTRLRVVVGAV